MFLDIIIDRQSSTEIVTNIREFNSIPSNGVATLTGVGAETWPRGVGHPDVPVLEAAKKTERLGFMCNASPKIVH